MASCKAMMIVPLLSVIVILSVSIFQPTTAARPFNGEWRSKDRVIVLESLKGSVPPSGPSGCTYVPRNGGRPCKLNGKNFAVPSPPAASQLEMSIHSINTAVDNQPIHQDSESR